MNYYMTGPPLDAHVFYRHSWDEVARLSRAIMPLGMSIKAVSTSRERSKMRSILFCEHFRAREAWAMVNMLARAARYTRVHVGDCLDFARTTEMAAAEELENALVAYWQSLKEKAAEATPTK
jgi:hypothetical protein